MKKLQRNGIIGGISNCTLFMSEGRSSSPEIQSPHEPAHDASIPRIDLQRDVEMYQLPGDPPLTDRDITRYTESNKKIDEHVVDMIEQGLWDPDLSTRYRALALISHAPEAERARLIMQGLRISNRPFRVSAAELIGSAPEADRTALIMQGLADAESSVRATAARCINKVPKTDLAQLIAQGLQMTDSDVQYAAISFLKQVPEAERTALIMRGLSHGMSFVYRQAIELIKLAPEKDRPQLQTMVTRRIAQGLQFENPKARSVAAMLIKDAPESERTKFIDQGMRDGSPEVRASAIANIEHAPEADRAALLKRALKDRKTSVQMSALSLLRHVPEKDRLQLQTIAAALIMKGLKEKNAGDRYGALSGVSEVQESDRVHLIEYALRDTSEEVRDRAIQLIKEAPKKEQEKLWRLVIGDIEQGLQNTDPLIRMKAIERITRVPETEQPRLQALVTPVITEGLEERSDHIRYKMASLIRHAPEADRVQLIVQGLTNESILVRDAAVAAIFNARETDRAQLIGEALRLHKEPFIRHSIAGLMSLVPEAERANIVEQGLRMTDARVRLRSASFITDIPEPDRARLIALYESTTPLKELASSTPLYTDHPDRFFRKKFVKTGSGTTLLDSVPGQQENSLRDRVIIRHIDTGPYLSWRKAYEAADFWKSKGFDYVPIEPIVKVETKKDLTIDVFTRVLEGPAVATWKKKGVLYGDEINAAVKKITDALEELGIKHGHTHTENFIVVFDRDEKGEVVLDHAPRVYVIDFDQAVSSR